MGERVVQNVCLYCGDTFFGQKLAKGCPKCRRIRANQRTRSFLRAHPDYRRRKVSECRKRLRQGIVKQPQKSAAIHQAKLVASATEQGWRVEFTHLAGKWSWTAEKQGAKLASAQEFEAFADARKDFLEAVF